MGGSVKEAGSALISTPLAVTKGFKKGAKELGFETPSEIKALDPGRAARQGERAAKEAQAAQVRQTKAIQEQAAREKQRIAEETSEIEKRRAMATRRRGGRSLLVATSPRGVTSLGGTS